MVHNYIFMNLSLFIKIVLKRINFYIVKLFNYKTKFIGKCCCKNLQITTLNNCQKNRIIFGKHVILKNCYIRFEGNNHTLQFGNNIKLENVNFFFEKENSNIIIGDHTWIGPKSELSSFDNSSIIIGKHCIFAKECMLRTSDSHIIKDSNNKVINHPQNITIGSHVWLGQQTFILKGAKIPDGCIVGAKSIVTASSQSEPNSILVGQPAKIIKKNISWEL